MYIQMKHIVNTNMLIKDFPTLTSPHPRPQNPGLRVRWGSARIVTMPQIKAQSYFLYFKS